MATTAPTCWLPQHHQPAAFDAGAVLLRGPISFLLLSNKVQSRFYIKTYNGLPYARTTPTSTGLERKKIGHVATDRFVVKPHKIWACRRH